MGRTLEVLKGVDLIVDRGQMLSIVGPSGAGKSTLLHCMGTLDTPTSGEILSFLTTPGQLPFQRLIRRRAMQWLVAE